MTSPTRVPLRVAVMSFVLALAAGCDENAEPGGWPLALKEKPAADASPASGWPLTAKRKQKSASPASDQAVLLRERAIKDPGLQDMTAMTVLIPKGWQLEGGITRNPPQLKRNPYIRTITITAPDGREVGFGPNMHFRFSAFERRPFMHPTKDGAYSSPMPPSVGAFLQEVQTVAPDPKRTDVRIVSEVLEPSITKHLRDVNAKRYQEARQRSAMYRDLTQQYDIKAHMLIMRYKSGGKQMEATVFVRWEYLLTYRNGQIESGAWSISGFRSVAGPVGSNYRNDPVLMAVARSLRENPAWNLELKKHWNRVTVQGWVESRERMAALRAQVASSRKSSESVSDMMMRGWRRRNAMTDAGQARLVDSIHEQTPYRTLDGNAVALPSYYDHVYADGQGTYLLHNNANFDPRSHRDFQDRNWKPLKAMR